MSKTEMFFIQPWQKLHWYMDYIITYSEHFEIDVLGHVKTG